MGKKHTPGPWLYNDTTAQVHRLHGAAIAEVCNHDLSREANARLIAAAPDLLSALIDLLYQSKLSEDEGGWDFSQAEEAIAKATGQ